MSEGWAKQLEGFQGDTFSPYNEKTGEGLERGEPTEEELRDNYAAPGRPAEHETGVLFRADHETLEDGMCRQARAHALALSRHVPLVLRSINNRVRIKDKITKERITVIGADDALDPGVYRQVGALRRSTMRRTSVCVNHTVLTSAAQLWRLLVPSYAQNDPKAIESILKASIVYTPWERNCVAPDMIALLNNVGQVWLQCERNRAAFVDSGLHPKLVRLVPNAFDPEAVLYQMAKTRTRALRNHGRRAFYTIGKWEPRKEQHRLIGAFLRTFTPTGRDTLYVKTLEFRPWPSYPTFADCLLHWLADDRVKANGWTMENFGQRLFVDMRALSDRGIAEVHLANDIYVSAAHAEGWDYPAFDAVSIGNRLVHVGFGGSEDYATPEGYRNAAWAIPWRLAPVDPVYEWEPESKSKWAEYTDHDLEEALQRATAASLPPEVPLPRLAQYHESAVGLLMATHVRELAEQTGQPF